MNWPMLALGDVVTTVRNGLFARRPNDERQGTPILRISAVRGGKVDLTDSRFVEGVTDEQLAKFLLNPDDLLMTRYNGSRHLVGIAGLVSGLSGPMLYPDKLIRLVADRTRIDPRFLMLQLQSPTVRSFLEPRIRTTAGQSGIAGGDVRSIPLVVPGRNEQRRIVEILEDHLSRLDAALSYADDAHRRAAALRDSLVFRAVTGQDVPGSRKSAELEDLGTHDGDLPDLPTDWTWMRLGDIAEVVGGVTKDAKKQSDPRFVSVPYLRVANVQRGALRLDDVTTIRVAPEKAAALRLEPGDVLLNEGGDRDKLARGWVWQGEIDNCIHQNHVFRARISVGLDPYFLSWTANTLGGRWAERNGKQSVNLASISLSMIRKMPVVLPPPGSASELMATLKDRLTAVARLEEEVAAAEWRSRALRRATLAAAFEGKLTGRHTDTEVIEELAHV